MDPTDKYFLTKDEKTLTWRAPIADKSGETLYIWFVENGRSKTGACVGWKYTWKSANTLGAVSTGSDTATATASKGSIGRWVLSSYEYEPKTSYPNDDEVSIYVDKSNKKVITECKHRQFALDKGGPSNWGFFEAVHAFPKDVIEEEEKVSVDVTMSSLGGFGYATWGSACVKGYTNLKSSTDSNIPYFKDDKNESDVNVSSYMSKIFESNTKTVSQTAPKGKAGDTYTIYCGTYRGGYVGFKYKYVVAGSDSGSSATATPVPTSEPEVTHAPTTDPGTSTDVRSKPKFKTYWTNNQDVLNIYSTSGTKVKVKPLNKLAKSSSIRWIKNGKTAKICWKRNCRVGKYKFRFTCAGTASWKPGKTGWVITVS